MTNACQILAEKMQACLDIANNPTNPDVVRKECLRALKQATEVAQPLMAAEAALERTSLLMAEAQHILLPNGRTLVHRRDQAD